MQITFILELSTMSPTLSKNKRVNWRKEFKLERQRVLNEVHDALLRHKRTIPKDWERGYMSAVTTVEILKDA